MNMDNMVNLSRIHISSDVLTTRFGRNFENYHMKLYLGDQDRFSCSVEQYVYYYSTTATKFRPYACESPILTWNRNDFEMSNFGSAQDSIPGTTWPSCNRATAYINVLLLKTSPPPLQGVCVYSREKINYMSLARMCVMAPPNAFDAVMGFRSRSRARGSVLRCDRSWFDVWQIDVVI